MTLSISRNKTISEVRSAFRKLFPFLKIEFFRSPHEEKESTSKKEMYKKDLPLEELNPKLEDREMKIDPSMTVEALETMFREELGLYVQVFRKSGRIWLETSTTDGMTLKAQNDLGREKATPLEEPDLTDIDYD
jgi:hypothetical protein